MSDAAAIEPERMRVAQRLQWVIRRPFLLIPLGVAVSFVAWLSPAGPARGFDDRTEPTVAGVAVYVGFVLVAAGAAFGGWRSTGRLPLWGRLDDRSIDVVHLRATIVAFVGVVGTYGLIEINEPGLILDALRTSTFNRLRQAIPYEAGFSTLRYAAIAAGGISAGRLLSGKRPRVVDVVAIVLLLASAAIASRLSLGLAVFIAIYTLDLERPTPRRQIAVNVMLGLLLVVALGGFNYIRNSGYYRERAGISDPVTMTYYESVRYWNAPTQVGLAVADPRLADRLGEDVERSVVDHVSYLVVPTYFVSDSGQLNDDQHVYNGVVDVDPGLTTNTILAATLPTIGWWIFPLVAAACFVGSGLVRYFGRFGGAASLVAPTLAYPFVEFWRIWLFNAGVVHFVALLLLVLALTARRT
jgi:hypothetical protein